MKRHGNLWNKIVSEENIRIAVYNACRNVGSRSKNKRKNVEKTLNNIEETVRNIQDMLVNGTFRTSRYYIYPLFDPKLRFIYCLPFYPDRVVHHVLLNVLAPIWDGLMYSGSYACRKGYGQHMAGTKCAEYARKYKYCCQFDISQFYINIDHAKLKSVIRKKIKDNKVLEVLDGIIDSVVTRDINLERLKAMQERGSTCKDVPREIQKLTQGKLLNDADAGLPIGNYTSQWFGNIYMNELDMFVKHNLKAEAYIRYCDDFLIFNDDKEFLKDCAVQIRQFLLDELKLPLSKCEIFPTSKGVDFVGYRYFADGRILIRYRTAKKKRRFLRKIKEHLDNGMLKNIKRVQSQLGSMNGIFKWAKSYNFQKKSGYINIKVEVDKLAKV